MRESAAGMATTHFGVDSCFWFLARRGMARDMILHGRVVTSAHVSPPACHVSRLSRALFSVQSRINDSQTCDLCGNRASRKYMEAGSQDVDCWPKPEKAKVAPSVAQTPVCGNQVFRKFCFDCDAFGTICCNVPQNYVPQKSKMVCSKLHSLQISCTCQPGKGLSVSECAFQQVKAKGSGNPRWLTFLAPSL